MDRLFTPWRYDYLVSDKAGEGCIFCEASTAGADRERLIVFRGRTHFIILNRFPYNNAHLMIVPHRHLADLTEATPDERHELMDLSSRALAALRGAYHPQGFNVGCNLGTIAGAGIADHYHLHIVPRWEGDTNFMTVTATTRVIPEALDRTWERLSAAFRAQEGG